MNLLKNEIAPKFVEQKDYDRAISLRREKMLLKLNRLLVYGKNYRFHSPFYYILKLFIMYPVTLVTSIVYTSGLVIYLVGSGSLGCVDSFAVCMKATEITFLFFLFLSFEFFNKVQRDRIEETIASIGGRHSNVVWMQVILLVLLDVPYCTIFAVYQIRVMRDHEIHSRHYLLFILVSVFLYHFLLYLFAILGGRVFSLLRSKAAGYCLLVVVWFLFSPRLVSTLHQISYGKEWLYRISDLLGLYSRDYESRLDFYYIFSLEAVNFQRILFWILLMLSVIFICSRMRTGKIWGGLAVIGTAVSLISFFQPTSAVSLDCGVSGQDALTADDVYYQRNDCMDMTQYREADFRVKSYDFDLAVRRELKAEVTVELDGSGLQEYYFTLYHGYRLENVRTSLGTGLPFEQKGDHIRVLAPEGEQVTALTFTYEGSGKRHYSTEQGIFLPGYFAYYPMPGWRQVYIWQNGYSGNTFEGLGYEVPFHGQVHTEVPLYSNLSLGGDGMVSGTSDGMTLLGSYFAEECEVEGCRIVYPLLCDDQERPDEDKEEWASFIRDYAGSGADLTGKTIFIPPYMNGTFWFFGTDQVIGRLVDLEDRYEKFITEGELYPHISDEEMMQELEEMQEMEDPDEPEEGDGWD